MAETRLMPRATSILLGAIGDVGRHFLLPSSAGRKPNEKPWRQGNEQREIQDMMRRRR